MLLLSDGQKGDITLIAVCNWICAAKVESANQEVRDKVAVLPVQIRTASEIRCSTFHVQLSLSALKPCPIDGSSWLRIHGTTFDMRG